MTMTIAPRAGSTQYNRVTPTESTSYSFGEVPIRPVYALKEDVGVSFGRVFMNFPNLFLPAIAVCTVVINVSYQMENYNEYE